MQLTDPYMTTVNAESGTMTGNETLRLKPEMPAPPCQLGPQGTRAGRYTDSLYIPTSLPRNMGGAALAPASDGPPNATKRGVSLKDGIIANGPLATTRHPLVHGHRTLPPRTLSRTKKKQDKKEN